MLCNFGFISYNIHSRNGGFMLNSIAIWGGIVGMGVAVLALLLMVFTKKDIADIVNRDVILFDQNFALKKQAIEKAF